MVSTDQQLVAQERFASRSFLVLTGLPKGSEFGLDGRIWSVDSFSGVKLLPQSLHFFLFSAAPTNETPETLSSGVGVRHGLLRFFKGQETVVEEWDNKREQLASKSRTKRRRTSEGEREEPTVVSQEYLKGLDAELAPYSDEIEKGWKPLVSFITESTLARVVGLDERGNASVDAVMGTLADEKELKAAGGKQTWGKVREVVEEDEDDDEELELLRYVAMDAKRSWPEGAVGEELSRWSKDKSWCLSNAVDSQLGGDVKELLAELQLAFVLFTLLHNFSSLTTYKTLFSLVCRSSSLALPTTSRRPSSPALSQLLTTSSLPLFASFLTLFASQLSFLDPLFFAEQMPSLDFYLLEELDALNSSLSDAAAEWSTREGEEGYEVWREVVKRWDALANVAVEKFGWELGMIKGSRGRKHGYEGEQFKRDPGVYSDDEVDLDDLEEGEDAPVIVEL